MGFLYLLFFVLLLLLILVTLCDTDILADEGIQQAGSRSHFNFAGATGGFEGESVQYLLGTADLVEGKGKVLARSQVATVSHFLFILYFI